MDKMHHFYRGYNISNDFCISQALDALILWMAP